MLERLVITDFQCHAKFAVNLERVVTFVGCSDVGKSALLRAIRWIAENRPQGDSFIRAGQSLASAALRVDGQWVVRKRGKNENVYEFNGETYNNLKAVPDAILQLLNIASVSLQGQLDSPFWLTDSAGEVSRNLNAVINLGEIDDVMARAAADVRRFKSESEMCARRQADAAAKRDALQWAVDADSGLRELEGVYDQWGDVRGRVAELGTILAELDEHAEKFEQLDREAVRGRTVFVLATELRDLGAKRESLAGVLADIERHESTLAADPTDAWAELVNLRAGGDEVAEARRVIEFLLADIEKAEGEVWQFSEDLEKAEKELATAMDGRCPLCSQPATPDQLRASCQTFISPTNAPAAAAREPVRVGMRPRRAI